MRPIMCAQRQAFDSPSFAIGQVLSRQTRKEHRDLLPCVVMGHIGDLRPHDGRVGNDIIGDGDG